MSSVPSVAELADAVRAAVAARTRRGHLDAQLSVAQALVEERRREHDELARALTVEEADVRRLEGLSPTRLWLTLRGDVDERLAVERAEADAAARAVTQAQARLDEAVAGMRRVREDRDALGAVDRAYAEALDAYEAGLATTGAPEAVELTHLLENLGRAGADAREIDEASRALEAARAALAVALEKLDSAGGWSTYDTFFGGGMIADLMKHSRIDEATRAFTAVNRTLERLAVELADIDAPPIRGVEISQTLAVFDVLFDNVFADWMVRERIAQARAGAVDLHERLSALADYLARRAADTAGVLAALTGRRERLLTAAV